MHQSIRLNSPSLIQTQVPKRIRSQFSLLQKFCQSPFLYDYARNYSFVNVIDKITVLTELSFNKKTKISARMPDYP